MDYEPAPQTLIHWQITALEQANLRAIREALIGVGAPGAALQKLRDLDTQIAALRKQLT